MKYSKQLQCIALALPLVLAVYCGVPDDDSNLFEQDKLYSSEPNGTLNRVGNNGTPAAMFPLGHCEGDCDNNGECQEGLVCFQRSAFEAVPGCAGTGLNGRDYCYEPPDQPGEQPGGNDVCHDFGKGGTGATVSASSCGNDRSWDHGSSRAYDRGATVELVLDVPDAAEVGDLLVLFLARTDDLLPLYLDDWTRAAECLKEENGWECMEARQCIDGDWRDNVQRRSYCNEFHYCPNPNKRQDGVNDGEDLGLAVFYKTLEAGESRFRFDIEGSHPAWAVLYAIHGAVNDDPIAAYAVDGNDGSSASIFPSVQGRANDLLLLAQAFDDGASRPGNLTAQHFKAPVGTRRLVSYIEHDESTFLFGCRLVNDGPTGRLRTTGNNGGAAKDVMITLRVRMQ
jgi:hypothetical protein